MAIAFDAASDSSTTGTSLTFSHTCSGDDRALYAAVASYTAGDVITGVTYDGEAMTQVGTATPQGNTRVYLFRLLGPATGANDIVVSASGSTTINCAAASYTGVKQTGQPDSNNTGNGAGTTITGTTTVVATSWLFAAMYGGSGNLAASTGTTQRGSTSVRTGVFDSNGTVAAGSRSLVATCANDNWGVVIESLLPAMPSFSVSDTCTASETVTALRTRLFSVSDTATLSEVVTAALGKIFSVADTVTATDTVTAIRARIFSALDTLTASEPFVQVRKLWANLARAATSWTDRSRSSTSWTNRNKS